MGLPGEILAGFFLCRKEVITMQEYWDIISKRHQQKLVAVARKKGIGLDTAMRNIINYLKSDDVNSSRPDYFKDFITARHVEGLIDTIVL